MPTYLLNIFVHYTDRFVGQKLPEHRWKHCWCFQWLILHEKRMMSGKQSLSEVQLYQKA